MEARKIYLTKPCSFFPHDCTLPFLACPLAAVNGCDITSLITFSNDLARIRAEHDTRRTS